MNFVSVRPIDLCICVRVATCPSELSPGAAGAGPNIACIAVRIDLWLIHIMSSLATLRRACIGGIVPVVAAADGMHFIVQAPIPARAPLLCSQLATHVCWQLGIRSCRRSDANHGRHARGTHSVHTVYTHERSTSLQGMRPRQLESFRVDSMLTDNQFAAVVCCVDNPSVFAERTMHAQSVFAFFLRSVCFGPRVFGSLLLLHSRGIVLSRPSSNTLRQTSAARPLSSRAAPC